MAKLLDSISYIGGIVAGFMTLIYLLLLVALAVRHLIKRKRK